MRLSLACAALVFAARAGAVQLSAPAGAGPRALHASPLEAWDAGAGEAFIFSGDDRGEAHAGVRPTLHRSPLGDEDWLLLVVRLSE